MLDLIIVGILSIVAIPVGWSLGRQLDSPKPIPEVSKMFLITPKEFYN